MNFNEHGDGPLIPFAPATDARRLDFALTDRPAAETDASAADNAETLAATLFDVYTRAKRPVGPDMDDGDARAEAVYMSRALTGSEDVHGRIWNGGRPFASGREFLQRMRDFVNRDPAGRHSPRWREYMAKDRAGRLAEAMEARSALDRVKRGIGDVAAAVRDAYLEGGVPTANPAFYGHAAYAPASEEAKRENDARRAREREEYERQVMRDYELGLARENAWDDLTSVLALPDSELGAGAKECVRAVMASEDARLPEALWAKFNALSDVEKQVVCRARQVLKSDPDGDAVNFLKDVAVGAVNVSAAIAAAPWRFGNKLGQMAFMSDYGVDVNELSRRRQLLWEATGDFFAGGAEGGHLPQLQLEQACSRHGLCAEAVIGAVTTLPYMAAAAVPVVGAPLVALEAMSEMDDHVALEGGDTSDPAYICASAVFGGLYAYTERLQLEGLLGGVSDLKVRTALLKGLWKGSLSKDAVRSALAGTVSESVQEGLQNGIMEVNDALALDRDATRAFAEGFASDFVGSLGTMLVVEAGGRVVGHAKRSGYLGGGNNAFTSAGRAAGREARSADVAALADSMSALQDMVSPESRGDAERTREIHDFYRAWRDGGAKALRRRFGLSEAGAAEVDGFFRAQREAEGAAAAADAAVPESMDDEGGRRLREAYGDFVSGRTDAAALRSSLSALGFTGRGADDYALFAQMERDLAARARDVGRLVSERYVRANSSGEGRAKSLARVAGAMEGLDPLRSIWAGGAGVRMADKSGKAVADPGARALEAHGFAKADAERLSLLFHHERAAARSRVALDGVKALYEARTRGRADALAAMRDRFGGRMVRLRDGVDANGEATFGDYLSFRGRDGSTKLVQIVEADDAAPDFTDPSPALGRSVADALNAAGWADAHGGRAFDPKSDWEERTAEERERVWRENGLSQEGFYTPVARVAMAIPGGPAVDSAQAAELVGRVTVAAGSAGPERDADGGLTGLQRPVDSSAVFHEAFHAFADFANKAGIFDEKDLESLRGRYGDPAVAGEAFDEEAGAEAFRAYLSRRMEGAASEEDESSPWRRLAALVFGLKRQGEERAAREAARRTSEERFYDQVVADAMRRVGDLSGKEAGNPAPAPSGPARTPPDAPAAPARPAGPADAQASPAAAPEASAAPSAPPPAPAAPAAAGTWSAFTPTGNVRVSGHWQVFDLSELVHSNNPLYARYMRAQLRDRRDNKAEEDTRGEIVNNFQAERLLDAPDTANGAPIVFMAPDESGTVRPFVLSGNGRVLVLNELAERHLFDRYRDTMKRWAAANGVRVPDGDTPVLVRVIDDYGGETRDRIADLSNTNSIQQYNEEEQARADAEVVRAAGLARLYVANADGTPNMAGANDGFFAEFARGVGDSSLYTSDRRVTQKAVLRATRALMAIAAGQGPRGRDVVKKLVERTSTLGIDRQKNAVVMMAAPVAALEAKPEYAIGPDVSRAVADFMDYVERRAKGVVGGIGDVLAEVDMFEPRSEIAGEILGLLASKRSAERIAEYVKEYCRAAGQEDPAGNLFGAARTRTEIWRAAARLVDERAAAADREEAARHSVAAETRAAAAAESRAVRDRWHNADGTPKRGWMKAPNGKPTKLTERQWCQVRTPSFKRWFGDWEAAAELAPAAMLDAKAVFKALMARKAEMRTADGVTLRFVSQSAKAFSREAEKASASPAAHWCALSNVEALVGRSRFLYEERPRNGSQDIEAYVKYGAAFSFGGERYLAKITSKRYPGRDAQNLYSVESVSVEKIAVRGMHEAIAKGQPLDADSVKRIADFLSSVNPASVSKVVDENGEPMVVYHGARRAGFSVFDDAEGGKQSDAPEGTSWFSSSPEVARSYSGTPDEVREYGEEAIESGTPGNYACFLNIRDPHVADFEGQSWNGDTHGKFALYDMTETDEWEERVYPDDGRSFFDSREEAEEFAESHGIERYDVEENPWLGFSTNSAVRDALDMGRDGAILENVDDNGSHFDATPATDYVVFSPEQIKSATDNTGAFDANDPDIRFSVRVNPRLREDVEAALNTDRAKGEVFKGGRRVVICDAPRIFSEIGIPDGAVYTKAYTLRKIAHEHSLTAEQIASAPDLLERPAAVFDDNGEGFVFLTDATAPDRNGENAPVMIYVRQDGSGNYVASAYSRTAAAESKYVSLVNARKVLYIDKEKVAHLPLRGEALSSLITFSVGDNVKTAEEYSTWTSTRTSIPQSGAEREAAGQDTRFSVVSDRRTLDWFDGAEKISTYRTFVRIGGKLYSPVRTRVGGKLTEPVELGTLYKADERPETAHLGKLHSPRPKDGRARESDGKWYVDLDKGKDGTLHDIAYNPYWHSSNLALNDQFTSAWRRDLVTVRCEIAREDVESGYRAERAHSAVGRMPWHKGTVAKQLDADNDRYVYLSRFLRPVEVLSDDETAALYVDAFKGRTDFRVDGRVVTPGLARALRARGVAVSPSPAERAGAARSSVAADTRLARSARLVENENADAPLLSRGADTLDAALANAAENAGALETIVRAAAAKTGGEAVMRPPDAETGKPTKGRASAERKLRDECGGDVSRLVDLVGGTVVLDDGADLSDALMAIRAALPDGASVARVKKLNFRDGGKGYRDVKVSVRFANGGIGEVILVERFVNDAKFNRGGHAVYEIERVLKKYEGLSQEVDAAIDDLKELSEAIYGRGADGVTAEYFARMKARASSSLTRLLRPDSAILLSSRDMAVLKKLSSGLNLARISQSSYATPASSLMKNIGYSFADYGGNLANGGASVNPARSSVAADTRLARSARLVENENADAPLLSRGADTLDAALANAAENADALEAVVRAAAAKTGGEAVMRPPDAETGKPTKGRASAERKLRDECGGDVSRLVDLVGGTVVLDDGADLSDALMAIRAALPDGASVARVKKFRFGENDRGYRDVKVSVRFANGGIGEVILVERFVNDAKFNRGGHAVYEITRILKKYEKTDKAVADALDDLDNLSQAIYGRGADAVPPKHFARMKARASSSMTCLLGPDNATRLSSGVMDELKKLSLGLNLAKPSSISNATPASSLMKNIGYSFDDYGGNVANGGASVNPARSSVAAETRLARSARLVENENADAPLLSRGADTLDAALANAAENAEALEAIVRAAAAKTGGEAVMRPPDAETGKPTKGRASAERKLRDECGGDVSRLVDLVGGTVVLDDGADLSDALMAIRAALPDGASVARVKKLRFGENDRGYRDVKVSVRFANGGIGEVILIERFMNDAKFGRGGHAVYEIERVLKKYEGLSPEVDAARNDLKKLSEAIYGRGADAVPAEHFARIKARASSSMTCLLGPSHATFASSSDMDELKKLSSGLNLAGPPSVNSYATPASSLMKNIGYSFADYEGNVANGGASVNPLDGEAVARRSVRAALADGGEGEAEKALANYVAYFKLSHGGTPSRKTLSRMGLAMGMKTVMPDRIRKSGEKMADRVRGTLIERAARNGDVATALALMRREGAIDEALDGLVAGAAAAGGEFTRRGAGRVDDIVARRVETMMNSLTAASLADMEGETGIDVAQEILANDPSAFDPKPQATKASPSPAADEDGKDGKGGDGGADGGGGEDGGRPLSDREKWERERRMKEAEKKVRRLVAEAKRRAEERRLKDEERRRRAEERRAQGLEPEEGGGGGDGDGFDPAGAELEDAKRDAPKGTVRADFADPYEFAAFLRVWAADRFARQHGHSTLAQAQRDRLFAEFYRICARRELGDLADKLLAPKGARAFVNRRLQDLEKGVRPDTVERISAGVFAFINKAAVREQRAALVAKFKNDVRKRYFKGSEFDQMKQDTDRKVTGWVEEAARYVCRVCDLSRRSINGDPSAYERERAALLAKIDRRAKVYDDAGREVADAATADMETVRARARLAILDKFGAMTSLMPGQILDLQDEAFRYFEEEAGKLEARWRETRERQEAVRGALTAAIVAPGGRRYQEGGWLGGRLFDALNGLIRLRLEHLTRFAPDDVRARAKAAIDDVLVMLGDGETAYARALQEDRAAFFAGLAQIFQKPGGGADNSAIRKYLERMDEPIPEDLSRRLSKQGYAGTMTHGQMLQLLVSLEQGSFRDAVRANGREGQAELIRRWRTAGASGAAANVFTREDAQFVDWLRAFYERKRGAISRVTVRMTGIGVLSPDPLYCPVRRSMEDVARGLHADPTPRWDPISKAFSRRVDSSRDFDESRSIVGMFFESSEESAKLVAWAERGAFIRNVFTSAGVQGAIRRAFGAGELGSVLMQLEATFNGGKSRGTTPGEIAAADRAMNFITYAYLAFNPLSALKQTTGFAVWANALPNGFRDLWRHMTHVDKSVVRHIMESEEYKVRYGDEVGSGQNLATKGLYENPSMNPLARAFSGAGMKMIKWGDLAPSVWIAQGVYKDLLDRHMQAGMDYAAADRRAMTETFNLLEETQQSARTYNTNRLAIEHGRLARLLTQFATSPLQQLQFETQAWREWRDMVRHGMGEGKVAAARQRFWRAALINHVVLPAAMELVVAAYKLAMGEEPPWEREGAHWDFLVEILLGQFSSVFFLGALTQTTLTALFKREQSTFRGILPVEGAIGTVSSAAFLVHDLVAMDAAAVRRDLERAVKSTAPTRVPYNLARRVLGDSDADRKRRKERARAAR